MSEHDDPELRGQRLLSAVERITQSPEQLLARVARARAAVARRADEDQVAHTRRVGAHLIAQASTRAALVGGATALPALLPGGGTLLALLGGTLADMALLLKIEVELALCLTALHGWDIRQEHERQLAFLLASVSTYDEKSSGNALLDLARAQGTAIWNYGPRELSKLVLSIVTKLALLSLSTGLVRALPLVGVVVGGTVNKLLTGRVGQRCQRELEHRRALERRAAERPVVAARRRGAGGDPS